MFDIQTISLRILSSAFLGALIGLERERKKRAAGLRTHVLVALGSCVIMLVSLYVFEIYKNITTIDPGRIAAGVITGIGFLGAGTIIRSGDSVRGLTTAATIWLTSAIGLACGCGFFAVAVICTAVSLAVLLFLGGIEIRVNK